jgi:hypothetical protein
MRFTAPADASGINVGGEEFVISDGMIEVPNDYSQEGVAALIAHGYTPQPATTSAKASAAKARVAADQADADAADAAATQAAADLAGA